MTFRIVPRYNFDIITVTIVTTAGGGGSHGLSQRLIARCVICLPYIFIHIDCQCESMVNMLFCVSGMKNIAIQCMRIVRGILSIVCPP